MDKLKRLVCCVLIISCMLLQDINLKTVSASSTSLGAMDVEVFLDTLIGQKMTEFNIPNLTVSVVYDGEILLAKGYGYSDYDTKEPVDTEKTLFRIGSTSKLLTWTAIMQLVEQGKLDLDRDVNEYLDFEIPNRIEYKGNKGEAEPITLRHLMSHTPGFEDYMTDVFSLSEENLIPLARYVREERPARVFNPGEVSAYSNYGTSLAGYIVQVVSGVPFAQYIEENIYAPLGMKNSTFRQPVPNDLQDNLSKAYRYVNGEFREGKFEFVSEPAGSMSSSGLDMAKFMLAYLQGGQYEEASILKEETVQKMFAEQYTHHPLLDGMAHGFIKATFNGRHTFHHPGGTMLYDTGLYLIPDEQVGFFISHSGGNPLVNIEIFQGFLDRYFPSEEIIALEPTEAMGKRSSEFVGEYYQNRRSFTTVDAFLSLMIGLIRVETDNEGYLLVTHLGESNRFIEVEPGVYHNLREGGSHDYGGGFRTIVFGTDSMGKTMLMTDGPMSYSKAEWYETSGLTFLLLISSVLFIVGSLLYWGIKALIIKIRKKEVEQLVKTKGSILAMRVAALQSVLTFVFLVTFILEGEINPVYGLPTPAYTQPSLLSSLIDVIVSYSIVLVTGVMVYFSLASWIKGYWKLVTRMHYTFFAMFSVILTWIFYFWNVI
ncbi:CubicO group peptidase (beta-lactamase class C family) [Natranaerovirga pectinivora]|uniref:CubicO group peptidase (Beta-lactamase class C family) n=1 Tax=Natranaerovirga pectinivora TaxID=682400 RepID=A0A4R3MNF0_9FIRM|nr:serine hydrolase domain-containing protein [Natranaerovirga pectinivora]TCT16032.1 CubicO group peptidase (beta-lactamase class C family) [Natranaerovirga pectinivora]